MRLGLLGFVAILAGLPAFLIGGVHIQAQVLMGGLVCVWLFILLVRPAHKGQAKRYVYDGVFWWLLATCVFTAIQLIPLPLGMLRMLSPQTAEIFTQVFGGFAQSQQPTLQTLSLSPPETKAKLIRDLAVFLVFAGALVWGHRRWHLRMLLRTTVGAAMLFSALVSIQSILRISKPLLGLYSPALEHTGLLVGSPLVNLNHLGGYLLFHSLLALLLSLDAEDKRQRWFWTFGGVWMGGLVFLTLSRGAILAYSLGVVAFFFLVGYYASRRGGFSLQEERDEESSSMSRDSLLVKMWGRPSIRIALLGTLLFAVVLTELAFDTLYGEFKTTSISLQKDKLSAIYEFSAPLVKDFPSFGVGRGAMGMAWPRVSSAEMLTKGQLTVTHVESFLIQPLVDWGIWLGLLWLLCWGWLLWRTWRDCRGFVEHGVFLAISMLFLQNFADFNLEFLATSFPMFLVWGVIRRLHHERRKKSLKAKPQGMAISLLVGCVLLVLCTPGAWRENYRRVHGLWSQLEELEGEDFQGRALQLLKKRPSDYLVPLLVARHYSKGKHWKPQEALKWLKTAHYLNPTAGNIVLLRAYIYARLGLFQDACLDMDRAVAMSPRLLSAASYLVEQFDFYQEALHRIRSSDLAKLLVVRMAGKEKKQQILLNNEVYLFSKFPKEEWLFRSMIGLLLGQAREADRSTDGKERAKVLYKRVQSLLFRFHQIFPKKRAFLSFYKGYLLQEQGRPLDAISAYKDVLRFPKSFYFWSAFFQLMELRLKLRQEDKVRAMFIRGRRLNASPGVSGRLYYIYGRMMLRRYAYREALEAFEGALQYDASNGGYWFAVADSCVHLGFYQRGIQIYKRFSSDSKYADIAVKKIEWARKVQSSSQSSKGMGRDFFKRP
ncbi:MAG: tetratricopeptide repeat protein [Myxococcales bacterium]|nr:tetratricopeptide repeat protein [Myxococcales bacterium]